MRLFDHSWARSKKWRLIVKPNAWRLSAFDLRRCVSSAPLRSRRGARFPPSSAVPTLPATLRIRGVRSVSTPAAFSRAFVPAQLLQFLHEHRKPGHCGFCSHRNSWRIEFEALRSQLRKLLAIQNHDGTSLQADQSLFSPRAQLLIRAFARFADDLADLELRDGDSRR